MASCDKCHEAIVWADRDGKNVPFDEAPAKNSDTGPWKKYKAKEPATAPGGFRLYSIVKGAARVATPEDERLSRPLYTCHWDTCSERRG